MTAIEIIDRQLKALEAVKAGWQHLLDLLRSPNPSGRMYINGQWETTEQAIARVQGWLDRETLAIQYVSSFKANLG